MAFLGYNKLEKFIQDENVIEGFKPENLEGSLYHLTLGSEVYITNTESGKKEILDKNNPQVELKPGQYALLLTSEKISIPSNILAFIGIKFSIKVRGIINISGFHVDPGYTGKLIFAVYNAGAQSIIFEKGAPIFVIWFSELSGTITKNLRPYNADNNNHQNIDKIPKDIIEKLKGHLWNPIELTNRIKDVENFMSNKNTELKGRIETFLWALGIFITLLVALNIKFYIDWSSYKKGHQDGINEIVAKQRIEQIRTEIDSIISNQNDSLNYKLLKFDKKLDSLIKKNIKTESK